MMEYLEKLLEEKEWKQALSYAEELLKSRDNSPEDLATLHCAVMIARRETGDFQGALSAGVIAVALAQRLGLWDIYGEVCMRLGFVYYILHQPDEAEDFWLKYLAQLTSYRKALRHEALIWYNIGVTQLEAKHHEHALHALTNALDAAERLGLEREAQGARQALAHAYLDIRQLGPVSRLLAKSGHYLRHNPVQDGTVNSLLYYVKLRARLAFETRRFKRARILALAGIKQAEGLPLHQYDFHMMLARTCIGEGSTESAREHAGAAYVYAVELGWIDRQQAAKDLICEVDALRG